jgi:hypothetical protein
MRGENAAVSFLAKRFERLLRVVDLLPGRFHLPLALFSAHAQMKRGARRGGLGL